MVNNSLSDQAKELLYEGIDDYKDKHLDKIQKYAKNNKLDIPEINDEFYFRNLLITFLNDITLSNYIVEDPDIRKFSPEKAAIKMKKFLGKDGLKLYKKALKEESFSKSYRDAVYLESASIIGGPKWAERPIVMVAGPSACGKTFASNLAMQKISKTLKKKSNDNTSNLVIQVDGGIIREVSQMRKLMVQMSTNQGYSGLSDLHNKSHALEKIKDNVIEAAFASKEVGVIIPETFSMWYFSVDKHKKLMERADKLDDSTAKLIFTRVDGLDDKSFPDTVKAMGTNRAFKKDGFAIKDKADLNAPSKCESKKYGAGGFSWGFRGSKSAEKWYVKNINNPTVIKIVNDLVVVAQTNDEQTYRCAKSGDENSFLISRKVIDLWDKSLISSSLPQNSLKQFESKINPPLPEIVEPLEPPFDFKLLFLSKKDIANLDNKYIVLKKLATLTQLNLSDNKLCSLYKNYCGDKATLKGYSEFLANIKRLPKPDILSSLDLLLPDLVSEYKDYYSEFSIIENDSHIDALKQSCDLLEELNVLANIGDQKYETTKAKVKHVIDTIDNLVVSLNENKDKKSKQDLKIIKKLIKLKDRLIINTNYIDELNVEDELSSVINIELEDFFSELDDEYFSDNISKVNNSHSQTLDIELLRDVIIKKPELFFDIPKNFQQAVHHSLLQVRILGDSDQKKRADVAVRDIHSAAVANLQTLISPEKHTPYEIEQLFKGGISSDENSALRKTVALNLVKGLSERDKLDFHSEKSVLLIEQYLAKQPNQYKSEFFQKLKLDILNKGFSLDFSHF